MQHESVILVREAAFLRCHLCGIVEQVRPDDHLALSAVEPTDGPVHHLARLIDLDEMSASRRRRPENAHLHYPADDADTWESECSEHSLGPSCPRLERRMDFLGPNVIGIYVHAHLDSRYRHALPSLPCHAAPCHAAP